VIATVDGSTTAIVLVGAVFLAAVVEMVEALTIVLAVGHTRGWRTALEGTATAIVALGALVAVLGPALVHIPLDVLRLVVGVVLLIFGLQWLRKAVLRASGIKAMHDEDAVYAEITAKLALTGERPPRDRVAFVVAFKGVFLEGLEIVIAVLTLGTSAHRLGLAAATAGVAIVVVAAVGAAVAKQLSSVPENALKMAVGIMLVSYGSFWTGEGLKVRWPGGDVMLVGLVVLYALATALVIRILAAGVPALKVES
jgi:Ca2+/H+ antiporter, TMEM165/GDT1 family